MTAAEAETMLALIEGSLARTEARLTSMVNERTTNVISATTAIVGALQEELNATTEAVTGLSENIAARRAHLDERLTLAERRIETLADLVPGGAEALGVQPLRQVVTDVAAAASADRLAVWSAIWHLRLGLGLLLLFELVLIIALNRGWL